MNSGSVSCGRSRRTGIRGRETKVLDHTSSQVTDLLLGMYKWILTFAYAWRFPVTSVSVLNTLSLPYRASAFAKEVLWRRSVCPGVI